MWSHEKTLEAMSLFNLRSKATKVPCPIKGCQKLAVDMPRHLKLRHNMSDEQAQRAVSVEPKETHKTEKNVPAKKRKFKRRVHVSLS
jgi:hypothetical protein